MWITIITLGIDSGTRSTKTVALDISTGEILASAQQTFGFVEAKGDGAMEQDPAVWIAAVESTISQVLEKLGSRWGEVTGNAMLTGYTAPKILWVRQNGPKNWERTASVLLPHDYINWWLTGVKSMDYGDASGTALLDVKTRSWSAPVLDAVAPGLEAKIPPLRSSAVPAGTLRSELTTNWNLPATVTISSGGGDKMMGAIGTGNVRPGIMTASLGTSGTLYAFSPSPVVDPKGEVAAFCDSTGSWMPLA